MRGLGKVLVAIGLVVAIVAPAEASQEQHCVSRLVPLEPVGGPTLAALEPVGCYATYAEALEAGSGTSLQISGSATPSTLTDETVSLLSGASEVLIGTEYDGFGFAGASESYFAPATCSSGVNWGVANVGAEWNDRFQSGKGFGGCDTNRKFQHQNFEGAVRTCTPNCSDYGSLANQVTSLRWRP